MITTERIASGYDIELQLGSGWFETAVNLLNDHGLLVPANLPDVTIGGVEISFVPDWDLEITVVGLPNPVLAKLELNSDGTELTLTTDLPGVPPRTIPFGALDDLAGPPSLVKLRGDAEHEQVMAILANLDIQAGPQSDEPLPAGEFFPRGNPDDAQSFLPLGEHIAFGMGRETLSRFANDIWHTNLRASDGTHPMPDEENKKGSWSKVTMKPKKGKIKLKLEGNIPVDSPLIDVVPDPHVTVTLVLTPKLVDGKLSFDIKTDTDVDTGILGDIFAGVVGLSLGGVVGFVVGLFSGALLGAVFVGTGLGAVGSIITLEIAEVIIEGKVRKKVKAMVNGEPLPDMHCREQGIVQIATRPSGGFDLSMVDAIPTSIAISNENPADELLYKKSLLVTSDYDEITLNSKGFAVSGMSGTAEKFQPEIVSIAASNYGDEQLASLVYERSDGQQQEVTADDAYTRALTAGELVASFKLFHKPEGAILRIPEGKLACVCLKPTSIRREKTIVKEIEFESGLRLAVADAVNLQDHALTLVTGYQLIHPDDYNAYFRAFADFSIENNFESLPEFESE